MSDGEVIYGMPTLNYYKQNIKPEYATPDIDENGLPTRDIKGKPLPRQFCLIRNLFCFLEVLPLWMRPMEKLLLSTLLMTKLQRPKFYNFGPW